MSIPKRIIYTSILIDFFLYDSLHILKPIFLDHLLSSFICSLLLLVFTSSSFSSFLPSLIPFSPDRIITVVLLNMYEPTAYNIWILTTRGTEESASCLGPYWLPSHILRVLRHRLTYELSTVFKAKFAGSLTAWGPGPAGSVEQTRCCNDYMVLVTAWMGQNNSASWPEEQEQTGRVIFCSAEARILYNLDLTLNNLWSSPKYRFI